MELKVENYGPLDEALIKIDTPITLFAGPNNSGKTFISRTLHAIIHASKTRMREDLLVAYLCNDIWADKANLKDLVKSGEEQAVVRFKAGNFNLEIIIPSTSKEYIDLESRGILPKINSVYIPAARRTFVSIDRFAKTIMQLVLPQLEGFSKIFAKIWFKNKKADIKSKEAMERLQNVLYDPDAFILMLRQLIPLTPPFSEMIAGIFPPTLMDIAAISVRYSQEKLSEDILMAFKEFLGGLWKMDEGIFVDEKHGKVRVRPSLLSSGAVELIPLLLITDYGLKLSKNYNRIYIFIDEPEVHLEPPSQVKLAHFIFKLVDQYPKLSFIISTHSDVFLLAQTKYAASNDMLESICVYEFSKGKSFEKKIGKYGEVEIEGFRWALEKVTTIE